jgi:hypothetical protein
MAGKALMLDDSPHMICATLPSGERTTSPEAFIKPDGFSHDFSHVIILYL